MKILKHYCKTNWVYCLTLILDPRHELEAFDIKQWSRDIKSKSLEKFKRILKEEYATEENIFEDNKIKATHNVEDDDDEFAIDFNSLYIKATDNKTKPREIELDNYLASPRPDENTDVLKWWSLHEH